MYLLLQNPEIWAKATKSGYRKRRVRFKGGTVLTIQGAHEQAVVSGLLRLGWVVVAPEFSIRYTLDRKYHYYHPDFLITKEGRSILLEVKSEYTLTKDLDKNLAKFRAANRYCRKNGMTFVLCMLKKTAKGGSKVFSCVFPTKRTALGLTKRLNSI